MMRVIFFSFTNFRENYISLKYNKGKRSYSFGKIS